MTETITFSRILQQDLDVGDGTRTVRLADGSLHTLDRIAGQTYIRSILSTVATNGVASITLTFDTPAGARIHGATVKVTTALGAVISFDVGDALTVDRWGNAISPALNTETTSDDFTDQSEPIVDASYGVVLTANGANFNGTGQIEVCLHWSMIRHPRA